MGKIVLILALAIGMTSTARAAGDGVPAADRKFFSRLHEIMQLPAGEHKIYDGRNTIFPNVLYTIVVKGDERKIYEGDHTMMTRCLYTVSKSFGEIVITKGMSITSLNPDYVVKTDKDGLEIYKGRSSLSGKVVYRYRKK